MFQSRIPLIRNTLETIQTELQPGKDSLPPDVCEALKNIFDACDGNARELRGIFEEVIPAENSTRKKKYPMKKVIQRLGKGSKVEELMTALIQNIQILVNYRMVKSATPEQDTDLQEDILNELRSIKSSTAEEESPTSIFHSGGGTQTNNVNSGSGQQINNHGHVGIQHFLNGEVKS
ncbi:hypothetical protein UA08_09081 [Talaromyces atroroseus]|uniref:NACHT-NTPase and P-loop NTPases N-terminal domain-containing protein n=1 Tax=Talaromyces atroroseus TaxID=1441469 RepID=A0A1Q5Q706_TALAT|nr:hypothetical protein UA08_09081 [Talaromyces atroroseus]OKL55622.1 hypothetical protein UA08_09081 [Talaromyces atroroseus]